MSERGGDTHHSRPTLPAPPSLRLHPHPPDLDPQVLSDREVSSCASHASVRLSTTSARRLPASHVPHTPSYAGPAGNRFSHFAALRLFPYTGTQVHSINHLYTGCPSTYRFDRTRRCSAAAPSWPAPTVACLAINTLLLANTQVHSDQEMFSCGSLMARSYCPLSCH